MIQYDSVFLLIKKKLVIKMEIYKKHQVIASFSVAIFIVYTAFILLAMNQSVYKHCLKDYKPVSAEGVSVSEFEAELCYEQLSESFRRFFHKTDEFGAYELSGTNIKRIGKLKGYYRMAWLIAIISLCTMINSFVILSKRRLYKPFYYGGILAGGFTALHWLILMKAKRPVLAGVRAMVLHEDYDYFTDGDMLKTIIPPDYARMMFLYYLLLVLILSLVMVCIRLFILYKGRPHRF